MWDIRKGVLLRTHGVQAVERAMRFVFWGGGEEDGLGLSCQHARQHGSVYRRGSFLL